MFLTVSLTSPDSLITTSDELRHLKELLTIALRSDASTRSEIIARLLEECGIDPRGVNGFADAENKIGGHLDASEAFITIREKDLYQGCRVLKEGRRGILTAIRRNGRVSVKFDGDPRAVNTKPQDLAKEGA